MSVYAIITTDMSKLTKSQNGIPTSKKGPPSSLSSTPKKYRRSAAAKNPDETRSKRAEETREQLTVEQELDILQALINGAKNSHLVYLDRDFNFVRVNETYAQTCGYRPAEMIGKNHFALYPDSENEAIFARVRETGVPVEFHDKPFEFPDQPERGVTYWDWSLTPVKDSDGQVTGLIFSLFETTAVKRAEEALHEAHRKTVSILDSISDGFNSFDREWRYSYVNPSAARILRTTPEALLGRSVWEVWPKAAETRFGAAFLRAVAENVFVQVEEFYPEPLNLWLEARCYPSAEGLSVFFTDITARKQAEEALRESEEQFRSLADSIPNLAWWASSDGYIIWYNRRWYEYTGTTPEQMAGWGWQSVHDPKVLPKVLERWKASIATGEAFDMDFPLRGADGVFRSFLTRVFPLKDSAGRVLRWFGTNTDISALKQAEEEKNLALQVAQERAAELEAAIKELEGFSYSVSHDLRAPIRHMASFSALLKEEAWPVLGEESRKLLTTIIAASKRMGILVDDLLEFAKMGRKDMLRRPVDLGQLIQEIIDSFAAETKGRKITWVVEKLPQVSGDLEMLRLVFINLISNAVKFTQKRSEASIEIGYADTGGEHVIYVKDNGIGFDMTYYDKLYRVFHRLHSDSEFEGTGIGLANVQRIVNRHKGKVWAESKVGEGATFYISLPKKAH